MKKMLFYSFLILINVAVRSIFAVSAQATTINAMDGMTVGGYSVNAIGNDRTMMSGTANNIACADAVKAYVDSTELAKMVKVYNAAGIINQPIKMWTAIHTPTVGVGQSVDISSAGFGTILSIQLTGANNTTTLASVPLASIKSYSTTSLSYNIVQENTGVIGLLAGLIFVTTFTGITVHVTVTGY